LAALLGSHFKKSDRSQLGMRGWLVPPGRCRELRALRPPPRTRTDMPAAHTERRGRPSLRSVGPHPRPAFPPGLVLIRNEDARAADEPIGFLHGQYTMADEMVAMHLARDLDKAGCVLIPAPHRTARMGPVRTRKRTRKSRTPGRITHSEFGKGCLTLQTAAVIDFPCVVLRSLWSRAQTQKT